MVQVREVVKVFDGKEVLRHLNMSVERGTIYGLLGANGAGKSTTFKLISGLLQPNAGAIQFDGEEIQVQDRKFLKEMGILIETPVFYEHEAAAGHCQGNQPFTEASGIGRTSQRPRPYGYPANAGTVFGVGQRL